MNAYRLNAKYWMLHWMVNAEWTLEKYVWFGFECLADRIIQFYCYIGYHDIHQYLMNGKNNISTVLHDNNNLGLIREENKLKDYDIC